MMNARVDETAETPETPGDPETPGVPETPEEIDALRQEIDQLDADILRLVKRRAEVSRRIGAARMAAGGTRIVYNREMDVLARYRELGPEGRQLAMALLELGRGRLGR
jgi:chorismate mutase